VPETIHTQLAGAPSYATSTVTDMHAPGLEHIIATYYQGTNLAGRERVKLFNLVWDALYSEFAGRHGLYERNYAGNKEQQRLDALGWATLRGDAALAAASITPEHAPPSPTAKSKETARVVSANIFPTRTRSVTKTRPAAAYTTVGKAPLCWVG
jgi:hypothetical protein